MSEIKKDARRREGDGGDARRDGERERAMSAGELTPGPWTLSDDAVRRVIKGAGPKPRTVCIIEDWTTEEDAQMLAAAWSLGAENARLARALASVEPLARAAVTFAAERADIRRTPRSMDAAVRTLHEAAQRYADLPRTPAAPQPAPDVQTALADALEAIREAARPSMYVNDKQVVEYIDAALLLAGRKP